MSKGTAARLRVAPERKIGPLEQAKALAVAAPAEFFHCGYETWQWIFHLARKFRAIEGVSPDVDPWCFREAVLIFCDRAVEVLGSEGIVEDKYFPAGEPADDRLAEFLELWNRVRLPEGQGRLEMAFLRARAYPITVEKSPSDTYTLIASTAYHLQTIVGEGEPIMLPVRRLASLVGKSDKHVATLIRLLVDRGVLHVVDPDYQYKEGKARTYRFNPQGIRSRRI